MPDVTAEKIDRPRRHRRRWLLRIPIIVVSLAVVSAVLTQVFLWTDYPRQIAEAQVASILHVRAKIHSVSIGWLGHTNIEGVELVLPMESEPFVTIKSIKVQHASLPLIAFSQDLSEVVVDGVDLTARQDATGRWNVQQLVATPTKSSATQPSSSGNPLADLPSLHATNVRATLVKADGQRLTLPTVTADIARQDAFTANVLVAAGEAIRVDGKLGLLASMPQELRVQFNGLPSDVWAFFGVTPPSPLSADLHWSGRRTSDGVAGTLQLAKVTGANVQASGRVDVDAGGGGRVTARPASLAVTLGDGHGNSLADLLLDGGQLTYDDSLHLESLRGTVNGGRFGVEGTADVKTFVSDIAVDWDHIQRADIVTTGSARLRTARLFNGKLKLDLDARGGATLPQGEVAGSLHLDGDASSADAFAAVMKLEPLRWTPADGSAPIVLPPILGNVVGQGDGIRVDGTSANDPTTGALSAYAGFDRKTLAWWATFDASQLQLPAIAARGVKGPVDVSVAAVGVNTEIDLRRAYVKLDRGTLYATGFYDAGSAAPTTTPATAAASQETSAPTTSPATSQAATSQPAPRPLQLSTWAWYDKPVTEDNAAQLNSVELVGTVWGTVSPTNLDADMNVSGTELVVRGRRVGDVALRLSGHATDAEATIVSRELEALGGTWSLRGRATKADRWLPIFIARFRNIPVANLGELANRTDLAGTINDGSATVRVHGPRLDKVEMHANARGTELSAGPFRAESLDLLATLSDGQFQVTPTLREAGGTLTAKLDGDVLLNNPIRAAVTLEDWPAPYFISTAAGAERFRPRASGKLNAAMWLATGEFAGDVALTGNIERGDAKLAEFRLASTLDKKTITLTQFSLGTLDGTLKATGKLDLANFNATLLNANFDNLTPARLAWSNPMLADISGRLNGSFIIRPSTGIRPLGPLEVELNVRPDAVGYNGVALGDTDITAFADVPSVDAFRFVTDRAVVNIAGGRVEPFVRITRDKTDGIAQLVTVNFSNLDLGQLVKAVDNDGKELVGKVGGHVQLYGHTTDLANLTGDATINISQSDLANFGPVSALYDALAVGTAGNQPIGEGSVSLRVGAGVLTIDDANYFNRGVYASAFGPVRDLNKLPDSPIDHVLVVGSLQPLRAVKLPFFGDVNDTLAALQSSVTAIDVTGTLKEPKMQQVALSSLGDTFQKVLLGKVKERK